MDRVANLGPSLVVAVERRRLVALLRGLALEVDAVGVVDDAVEDRVGVASTTAATPGRPKA